VIAGAVAIASKSASTFAPFAPSAFARSALTSSIAPAVPPAALTASFRPATSALVAFAGAVSITPPFLGPGRCLGPADQKHRNEGDRSQKCPAFACRCH